MFTSGMLQEQDELINQILSLANDFVIFSAVQLIYIRWSYFMSQ